MVGILRIEFFFNDLPFNFFDELELFHRGVDHVYQCCVLEEEQLSILTLCHYSLCGGHYAPRIMVLQSFTIWIILVKIV